MADNFDDYTPGLESPPANVALVTPSDDTDLAFVTRGIIVGTGGTLRVATLGGQTVTLPAAAVSGGGQIIPGRFTRVFATGTTAADIVALW